MFQGHRRLAVVHDLLLLVEAVLLAALQDPHVRGLFFNLLDSVF